jgi:hypothetical protein
MKLSVDSMNIDNVARDAVLRCYLIADGHLNLARISIETGSETTALPLVLFDIHPCRTAKINATSSPVSYTAMKSPWDCTCSQQLKKSS